MFFIHLLLAAITYISPVHFDVSLAGNFGEPRPNHFHGGLDIKTQQEEGKAVYAIGDGYVCRVSVNVGGMGNAVYVRHPEGYTSVYAHLQRFAPPIEALVRKWQYQHQTTDVDMTLCATDYPVAQGQLIALSGDTGASLGPHLHLEIHQTDNWNMMDPLDFMPELLEDSIAPKAHAVMAYPVKGEGRFCGQDEQQRFDFMGFAIVDSLTAWGKVGFGLYAEDFMQGSDNRYGIRHTALYVDGEEVFSSDVDDIPMSANKMVNVWGDYDYYALNQQWFMRSFLLPGNKLPFLKADRNGGLVTFNQERDYQFTYVLCDFFGNQSKYSFTVTGRPDTIPPLVPDDSLVMKMDADQSCTFDGMDLKVPEGALLADVKVAPSSRSRRGGLSKEFVMTQKSVPLYGKAILRLRLEQEVDDHSKLYVSARRRTKKNELDEESGHKLFIPGIYHDGWVETEVTDLGDAFCIAHDVTPPRIIPVNQREWASQPLCVFDLKDEDAGIADFQGFVDGQFVLFDHVKKSSRIICDLRNTPVEPTGGEHRLQLKARDKLGNQSVFDGVINY